MSDQIKQAVKQFLENNFLISFTEIAEDTDLFHMGIIDSFGFVELVNFIEKKFAIKINDQDLTSDALISLTNITHCVNAKLRKPLLSSSA